MKNNFIAPHKTYIQHAQNVHSFAIVDLYGKQIIINYRGINKFKLLNDFIIYKQGQLKSVWCGDATGFHTDN